MNGAVRIDAPAGSPLRGFAAGLLDPDVEAPENLTGPAGAPAIKRYGVYRNNVVVGLMEAMRTAFPSLLAIMGQSDFDVAARNFVYFHPPKSPMMQAYGDEFAAFLAGFPPLAKAPWLADVARAERAFLDAAHAADADPLDAAALREADAMALTFAPHPALALIRSRYPVHSLFRFRDGAPDSEVDLAQPQCLMVTRPALEATVRELSIVAHDFLARLAAGKTLGDAVADTLQTDPDFNPAEALASAFSSGAFCAGGPEPAR
jgi:hypothetical protein